MPDVKKPIFIIGTGRCGSTIFHEIFSHHPQVAWLSRWCVKYPTKPHINRLALQLLDSPLPSYLVRKRVYPVEGYSFWENYARGFAEPHRDLLKEDVTQKTKKKVQRVMAEMLTKKRERLMIKITGWPRVGFLKEIFPDAKFIHVYRDGRAVVNSLVDVYFWSGWRGPDNWRWGDLTAEQRERWEKFGKSFVALACIEWEILMEAYDQAKQQIPQCDFMEIPYEELCQEPIKTFQKAIEFSELEWSSQFEARVKTFSLKNTNYKWQKDLSEEQQHILTECLGPTLRRYGYA